MRRFGMVAAIVAACAGPALAQSVHTVGVQVAPLERHGDWYRAMFAVRNTHHLGLANVFLTCTFFRQDGAPHITRHTVVGNLRGMEVAHGMVEALADTPLRYARCRVERVTR